MFTARTLALTVTLGLSGALFWRLGWPAWQEVADMAATPGPMMAEAVAPVEGPGGALTVRLTPVITGIHEPTDIQFVPGHDKLVVILEKGGRARVFDRSTTPPTEGPPLLRRPVRTASEQGLLGLAFDPDYAHNGRIFVSYSTDGPSQSGNSRIAALKVDPAAAWPVAADEQVVLQQAQPAPNHDGGQIAFGPDGLLYIGFGDGGRAGDPWGNAQNPETWLGKMLRIDVSALPYTIPPGNPKVAGQRPEIFASGLRNPWRFAFDPQGRLIVADVGQDRFEEVDLVPVGANLGWDLREGEACFEAATCATAGLTAPIFTYPHGPLGGSITGGYVHQGKAAELHGRYLFGDFLSGHLWALDLPAAPGQPAAARSLGQAAIHPSTFGRDAAGEVYVADFGGGAIYRIDLP